MLAPSDLGARRPGRVRVGGRVLLRTDARVELADAFGTISVHGSLTVGVGDLIVVSGSWTGRRLEGARLVARYPAPEPRGDGEVARLLFQGVGNALRARARALAAIREYFASQGFLEVETPIRVPAPGVDQHVDAVRAGTHFLITSPELEMKRLLVGGVPRQFQLARVLRRDEQGAQHEPEFTLLEWYRAFAGQEAIQRDTEAVVRAVARALSGRLELRAPDGRRIALSGPFERVTVDEAFRRHARVRDVADLAASDEARYFELLVSRVEPALARMDRPVFLCNYPVTQAALARPCPDDPRFAERFELYAGGIELANGYGELTDPVEQRRRFLLERKHRRAEKRPVYPLNERFLAALVEGMPPSGGNALGVDRLVALALGVSEIRAVIAFPTDRL
ncbi:MAG TPA: EF-P lysine aminoacylase EpmA [Polyangiaceae bacterium]|nr:EF-P lysine aminoacylase EpmA [Polyangiaceae bacterium]